MNPEIRFRVSEEIYSRAESLSETFGFDREGGRSAGVPLLARASLYRTLGIPWPDKLPKLPGRDGADPSQEGHSRVCLIVAHQVNAQARWEAALREDQAVPQMCRSELRAAPSEVPEGIRAYLELDGDGDLKASLNCPDLVSAAPQLTWQELDDYLSRRDGVRKKMRAKEWEAQLRDWVIGGGSEWVRALLEEDLDWLRPAEQEWAAEQIRPHVEAGIEIQPWQDLQSLAGDEDFQALIPDRQPSWARLQILRALRSQFGEPSPIRLQLVRGQSQQVRARQRSAGPTFLALLWQVSLPSGKCYGFLTHRETCLDQPAGGMQSLAPPS